MTAAPESERDQTTGRNKAATVGLVLGIVAVVVNPILLVGIGAIVVSAFGWNRAALMSQFGYAPVGRGRATWGLILGLVGIVESIVLKGSLF